MAGGLRISATLLILLAGIGATLPLQTGFRDRATPAADPADFSPRFDVGLRRGTLTLDGHAVSSAHEAALLRAAAKHFPGVKVAARFRPLGLVPDWWQAATVALVKSLAGAHNASARLTPDSLRVRGIAEHESRTVHRFEAFDAILPDAVGQRIDVSHYDAGTSAKALCARRFATFRHGPVRFDESGAALLPSAYPVLDRVVALADACRSARISITGHTDSSGSEAWNRQLSLERARAVADVLEARGVDPRRFEITGAGSSLPLADNATRYGRSLNRRIELGLSY